MKKLAGIIGAMVFGAVISTMAIDADAQQLGRGQGYGPGGGNGAPAGYVPGGCGLNMRALAALELSDAQSAAVDRLRSDFWQASGPIQRQLDARWAEIRELWGRSPVDKDSIIAKQNEMDFFRRQLRKLRVQIRIDLLEILNPDQQSRYKYWMTQGPLGGGNGSGTGNYGRGWNHGAGQGWGQGWGRGCGRGMGRGMGRDGYFKENDGS